MTQIKSYYKRLMDRTMLRDGRVMIKCEVADEEHSAWKRDVFNALSNIIYFNAINVPQKEQIMKEVKALFDEET